MDETRIVSAGLVAAVEETLATAALRYFAPTGPFAEAVRAATGVPLPGPLEARQAPDAPIILAWRSPTETLCITRGADRLADLLSRLAGAADGCAVELTGGLGIVRLTGLRTADLLCRLGSTASAPEPGFAQRSRIADLPVLALSVRHGETLLAVDRAYLPHLLGWIRETLLDFDAA